MTASPGRGIDLTRMPVGQPSAPTGDEVLVLVRPIVDREWLTARSLWSASDAAAVDRVVEGPARDRVAARRTLMRQALSIATGVDGASIEVVRTCEHCGDPYHGRPRPASGGAEVSASSTASWAAAAVSAGPVGLDLESVDRLSDPDLIAPRLLTKVELDTYRSLPGDLRADWLVRRWTRKEAVLKAAGHGVPDLPEPDVSDSTVKHRDRWWGVWTWRLAPGLLASVAVPNVRRPTVRWVRAADPT